MKSLLILVMALSSCSAVLLPSGCCQGHMAYDPCMPGVETKPYALHPDGSLATGVSMNAVQVLDPDGYDQLIWHGDNSSFVCNNVTIQADVDVCSENKCNVQSTDRCSSSMIKISETVELHAQNGLPVENYECRFIDLVEQRQTRRLLMKSKPTKGKRQDPQSGGTLLISCQVEQNTINCLIGEDTREIQVIKAFPHVTTIPASRERTWSWLIPENERSDGTIVVQAMDELMRVEQVVLEYQVYQECNAPDCILCLSAIESFSCTTGFMKFVIILVLVLLGMMVMYLMPVLGMILIFILKSCMKGASWSAKKGMGHAKVFWRKINPENSRITVVARESTTRANPTGAITFVILCVLVVSAHGFEQQACSRAVLSQGMMTACAEGTCTLLSTAEFPIGAIGERVCLHFTDQDGRAVATANFTVESKRQFVPLVKKYITAPWKLLTYSEHRCHNAGRCPSRCGGNTNYITDYSAGGEINGLATEYAGMSGCDATCGCVTCKGCFSCGSGCVFHRWALSPLDSQIARPFAVVYDAAPGSVEVNIEMEAGDLGSVEGGYAQEFGFSVGGRQYDAPKSGRENSQFDRIDWSHDGFDGYRTNFNGKSIIHEVTIPGRRTDPDWAADALPGSLHIGDASPINVPTKQEVGDIQFNGFNQYVRGNRNINFDRSICTVTSTTQAHFTCAKNGFDRLKQMEKLSGYDDVQWNFVPGGAQCSGSLKNEGYCSDSGDYSWNANHAVALIGVDQKPISETIRLSFQLGNIQEIIDHPSPDIDQDPDTKGLDGCFNCLTGAMIHIHARSQNNLAGVVTAQWTNRANSSCSIRHHTVKLSTEMSPINVPMLCGSPVMDGTLTLSSGTFSSSVDIEGKLEFGPERVVTNTTTDGGAGEIGSNSDRDGFEDFWNSLKDWSSLHWYEKGIVIAGSVVAAVVLAPMIIRVWSWGFNGIKSARLMYMNRKSKMM